MDLEVDNDNDEYYAPIKIDQFEELLSQIILENHPQ